MNFRTHILLSLFVLLSFQWKSQGNTDSLIRELKKMKPDTFKMNTLGDLSRKMMTTGNYARATEFINGRLELAEELSKNTNQAVSRAGKKGLASSLGMKGMIFMYQGNYPFALDYCLRAFKIKESLGDKSGMAGILGNIGLIYNYQKDIKKALDYDNQALKIYESINNKRGIANTLNSIGTLYAGEKKFNEALENYFRTLKINEELNDYQLQLFSLGNIGLIYLDKKDYNSALTYFYQSLKLAEEGGDRQNVGETYDNIGTVYFNLGDNKEAEKNFNKALSISRELGVLNDIREAEKHLSELYEKTGEAAKSLQHYKSYIAMRDSLFNDENTKRTVRLEMNYDFERKEAAAKLEQEKKEVIAKAESKKQQIIIYSVCGILILVMVFAVFIFRSYRQKQKANIKILGQKHIIEEKQKEILDSIRYAKRIQTALITSEKYIVKNMERLRKNSEEAQG
ncbi:MAG: tetratricopeptide repeat protein [Bacteroidetes bacterium]|nr:tetratricopeptide repeat protein [Bacteroidota bacterium]